MNSARSPSAAAHSLSQSVSASRQDGFTGTSRYRSPFPDLITTSPLRAEIDTSSTSSETSS